MMTEEDKRKLAYYRSEEATSELITSDLAWWEYKKLLAKERLEKEKKNEYPD